MQIIKRTLVYGLVVLSLSFGMNISAVASDIEIIKVLADKGDAASQTALGLRYEIGNGVIQDYNKAVELYEKAAYQGYAPAQFSIGNMHYSGKGVRKDGGRAVEWFQKAANQGYAEA